MDHQSGRLSVAPSLPQYQSQPLEEAVSLYRRAVAASASPPLLPSSSPSQSSSTGDGSGDSDDGSGVGSGDGRSGDRGGGVVGSGGGMVESSLGMPEAHYNLAVLLLNLRGGNSGQEVSIYLSLYGGESTCLFQSFSSLLSCFLAHAPPTSPDFLIFVLISFIMKKGISALSEALQHLQASALLRPHHKPSHDMASHVKGVLSKKRTKTKRA